MGAWRRDGALTSTSRSFYVQTMADTPLNAPSRIIQYGCYQKISPRFVKRITVIRLRPPQGAIGGGRKPPWDLPRPLETEAGADLVRNEDHGDAISAWNVRSLCAMREGSQECVSVPISNDPYLGLSFRVAFG